MRTYKFLEEDWCLFGVEAVEVHGIVTGGPVQLISGVKQLER